MHVDPQPEVVELWPDGPPRAELWRDAGPELDQPSWEHSRTIRNVSRPSFAVYLPARERATGTGVIVCPGGAFHFLMIDKEGTEVARWLNARGVAAFVLKYRVAPTPVAAGAFLAIPANLSAHRATMDRVWPIAVGDGLQALRIIRRHADRWGIARDRLGIIGFSAGGGVVTGAATGFDPESRPAFAAAMYAAWREQPVPADAPPLFLAAASDDPLVDARQSAALYAAWHAANRPSELHLYARGGHGFALNPQGLPVDGWIDRFWEWLQTEGFVPG